MFNRLSAFPTAIGLLGCRRPSKWTLGVAAALLLGALLLPTTLKAQERPAREPRIMRPAPGRLAPTTRPGEGPTCSLDATVYDVRLAPDQIGRLDIDALRRASGDPAAFEKALAGLGTTKPLYRVDQSVRLAGDNVMVGASTPVVSGSRRTNTGQVINTVTYQQTGAIFDIAGKPGAQGRIELDLRIEVATTGEGATPLAGDVRATVMRRATMAHKGPVDAGRPFVVVSVDAASPDADGKAVASIARIILGPPQPGTPPAGGK